MLLVLAITVVSATADDSALELRARVTVDSDGSHLVDDGSWQAVDTITAPTASHELEILARDGSVLARVEPIDPRPRTLLLPSGDGRVGILDRAIASVRLPWPEGAWGLRDADGVRRYLGEPRQSRAAAAGPQAVQVIGDGPAAERLDLVFLGDGYTEQQLDDFAADVDRVVDHLLDIPPYGAYAGLFNVWRVDVPSADSGVDQPSEGLDRDTAYGCTYDCVGVPRLVCCDEEAVLDTAEGAVPDAEGIMVLVNETEYGGSGGFTYATAYVGTVDGPEVAAHELGHSLIGLWDEYDYGVELKGIDGGPNCSPDPEGSWDLWLDKREVGAFEVCAYDNLHRPTEDGCMMRTLREGYCPICREQAVLAMYDALPSIVVSTEPPAGLFVGSEDGESARIEIATTVPADRLTFHWSVDGAEVAEIVGDDTLDVACTGWSGQLTVRVFDATPWVRTRVLEDEAGPWPVDATECATPEPTDPPPAPVACGCGTSPAAPVPALAFVLVWLVGARRR